MTPSASGGDAGAEIVFAAPRAAKNRLRYARLLLPIPGIAMIFLPFDFGSLLIWGAAVLAALWSVALLLAAALKLFSMDRRQVLYDSIGPLLAVAALPMYVWAQSISMASANQAGREVAADVQRQCIANARCPESIPGWVRSDYGYFQSTAGRPASYRLRFRASEDRRSFYLLVIHTFQGSTRFAGGVDVSLAETGDEPQD